MYNGKISCGKTMHLDTHCIVHAMSLYYRLGTGRYMTDNWVLRVPNKFVKGWRALGYTIRKYIKIGWKTKVWKVDLLIKTLCFRSISIVNIKRKISFFSRLSQVRWVKGLKVAVPEPNMIAIKTCCLDLVKHCLPQGMGKTESKLISRVVGLWSLTSPSPSTPVAVTD